jgi:predicted AlkP superfamily phosphohydrolase/phosphomutase
MELNKLFLINKKLICRGENHLFRMMFNMDTVCANDYKKEKTILIVLDGLDYSYIKDNLDGFKLFKLFYKNGRLRPLDSVVPADSIPSWITIYTGLNPAEHGIIESIDYLNFKQASSSDYSVIKDNSIWDKLGKAGKRVFIFNPFMAYPAWDVNGLMICGPVFEGGELSTNRPELVDISKLPPLGGLVDHPTHKTMPTFLKDNMILTQNQFDAFHQYIKSDDYDFAFLGILTSDRIQHFLWKYTDPEDNFHNKRNKLKNSLFDMYQLMEKNIQEVLNKYDDTHNIVIISDHGHGRRCQKTFYINQWLINEGIITDKSRKKRLIEFAKNFTLRIFVKLGCIESGTSFLKKFKLAHKFKNADFIFKKNGKVYVPKFDGCNPFGGICVNRTEFDSNIEYEAMRQKIINGLLNVSDNGKSIMLWVKRREDIYSGTNEENYPEIIYLMDSDYGVDRGLYGKRLFGINAMHGIISGGHKFEGVILSNRDDAKSINSVLNIHNYILDITK